MMKLHNLAKKGERKRRGSELGHLSPAILKERRAR